MESTPRGYPHPAPNDPPDGPSQLALLADAIDDDVSGVVQSLNWAPALASSITSPTLNNSVVGGRHWLGFEDRCDLWAWIRIGTTFSAGDGGYSLTLPVPASATYTRQSLRVTYSDFSESRVFTGIAQVGEGPAIGSNNRSRAKLYFQQDGTDQLAAVNEAQPFVWDTGDQIQVAGLYVL